uniref:Uncharacterized protein n=1 Tax=Fagus sylvatica TaxID=28930 RepID=A0A2N9IJJ2_FAGSY
MNEGLWKQRWEKKGTAVYGEERHGSPACGGAWLCEILGDERSGADEETRGGGCWVWAGAFSALVS